LPSFPTDLLPDWLRAWVVATAEATQTPPDLAGMLALGMVGAGLAGKFRVQVREGWVEPCNVFVVVALPPGERKSAVFAAAIAPVQAYEAEAQTCMAPVIAQKASEKRVLEERLKHLEKQAAKEDNPNKRERLKQEAAELACELEGFEVPDPPRMYCDDETPESLGQLLALQGGRMLQASAEGTAFEIAKGRYSEKPNFDVYLKGHSGDSLRVGRVSRGTDVVDAPALSAALAVQPDVIQGLAAEATMRGRGFLARWLYSLPHSAVGRRRVKPPPVPKDVAETYRETMLSIWRLPGEPDGTETLYFSPEADAVMAELELWVEPRLAEGEELHYLAGWAQKLAGAVARVAGALHIAGTEGGTISAATVEKAVRLGKEYLVPHAVAAFGLMGADPRIGDARRIVRWLSSNRESVKSVKGETLSKVTKRDIHTSVFGGSRRSGDLDQVLKLLEEYGYIRHAQEKEKTGVGRKPSPAYEVNPQICKSAAPFTLFTDSRNAVNQCLMDDHGEAWEGD
jgi:hypothetical protein